MMKLESKQLLELVKSFDDYIELPKSIAYSDISKYRTNIENIVQTIKKYNEDSNDNKEVVKNLKSLSTQLLRFVDEMMEDTTKRKYQHTLEIKKKNYIIKGLKDYIDSKEERDSELPADDEEEPTDTDTTSRLSKKEKEVLGIK